MIYGDKFLSPEEFPRSDAVNDGSIEEAHTALDRVDRDVIITDWYYITSFGGSTRYLVNQGFTVYTVSATNLFWHDSIPLARGHWWIVETLDRGIEDGVVGAFNSNWEFYPGQFFDNFWFFQALAAERQAGSAGSQPCRGITRWAHRADEAGSMWPSALRSLPNRLHWKTLPEADYGQDTQPFC
jgi:hypothetical protein